MVLATTALLLQFLAVPSPSVSMVTAGSVKEVAAAASDTTLTQPDPSTTEWAKPGTELAQPAPEATLDSGITYAPGRLLPERLVAHASVEPPPFDPQAASVIFSSEQGEQHHIWEQQQKKIWLGLTIASSGAAAFDAWTTRRVISSGRGHEANPMLRPFAGNNSMYAAVQVGPLLLDYLGRRMLTSEHGWMRRTWWVPQVLGTAVSVASGVNNLRVH